MSDHVDTSRANVARMYDYWLGGAQNFEVDRREADRIAQANPDAVRNAWANRSFLADAVSWCLDHGINQFLDLGSGVPTVGNVHEIALRRDASARIAYVDIEPVAAARAHELLVDEPHATITHADLRHGDAVLAATGVADLLDFRRPVALLAVAVLHYVADPLHTVLGPYLARLVPGSAVVVSHVSSDHQDLDLAARIDRATDAFRGTSNPVTLRTRAELLDALSPLRLIDPGLIELASWPTSSRTTGPTGFYVAIGTVPDHPR